MISYPNGARGDSRAIYRYVRRELPELPALQALSYARHLAEVDRLSDRVEWRCVNHDWRYGNGGGPMMIGELEHGGAELLINVYPDAEPYEWGDHEPTEDDRRNLEVIGVEVTYADGSGVPIVFSGCRLNDDGTVTSASFVGDASCWGIGYLHGDAGREALSHVIESGYLDAAATELREHDYWKAREVATV